MVPTHARYLMPALWAVFGQASADLWTAIGAPIKDLEFGARYALTKPTRHGRVWARLHKLRVQNPVLVFGDRAR